MVIVWFVAFLGIIVGGGLIWDRYVHGDWLWQ
jgi:hypothetical protein